MKEPDPKALLRLCSLLTKREKAELAYKRANYKVSYYRKLKNKLEEDRSSPEWSNQTAEWKRQYLDLTVKVESARLITLKKHLAFVKIKQKLNGPINKALNKSCARLVGNALYIHDGKDYWAKHLYTIFAAQIEEYADQYEAEQALDKALST